MSQFTATYNETLDIIEVVMIGRVDQKLIQQSRETLVQLVASCQCTRILCDLRQAISGISLVEIFYQPQRTAANLENAGISTQGFLRALVVNEQHEDARFFETVAVNRGQSVRIFRDLDEAIQWLTSSSST